MLIIIILRPANLIGLSAAEAALLHYMDSSTDEDNQSECHVIYSTVA
jgi:hypothetical protein